MNDKLTIQELAAYLPYQVKVSPIHILHHGNGIGSISHILTTKSEIYKLRLLPLSSLTKEIEHKGEKFVPIDKMKELDLGSLPRSMDYRWLYYHQSQKLLEWNFDIFGLLDRGLAVDKTTIQ